jgi:LPS sulfotransferase NodH
MIEKEFVFIIGAPRSGTTWLQALIGSSPAVSTMGEMKIFDFYTASWIKAWEDQMQLRNYGNISGLPTVWSEEDFYGFLQEFIS